MKVFLLILFGVAATSAETSEVLKNFAAGSNQFTANVYKEFAKSNSRGFMVCPLSVDVLLALFHAGAKGKTAQELSEGLNLPTDKAKIDETFTELSSQLNSTKDYILTSANKVYLKNGFHINDEFKSTAVNVFNAEIQNLNFGKHQEAANKMNDWVEEKTHNKIKNLVNSNDLEGNPVAVLINAMYFRGKWVTKFKSSDTKKRSFHVTSKNEIEVEMMELRKRFKVIEKLNAKFLEMPYEGDDITMTFALPNDVDGLSRLEANIVDVLVGLNYNDAESYVVIPKFKMETNIQFKPILEAIGIKEPFSNSADFSGFGANKNHLHISKIIQKTFIEVEEEGTTAAAGSAGFNTFNIHSYLPPPVFQFVADHPFIYYIKIEGVVVFVGRYTGH